ncbi:hypothetical protein OQJ18_03255 [Fluoribacter dumoffii]|uniref:Uncharacterized protein n=1 Tax=Fluoribacter dumoffii TaxID=463 RepID=A0A377GA00_9GAMM|nr:hypothetical protein [Fluoribacter dumoffii]KTC88940.1 hypothetical protein Ldum_3198 [Fluoribacter dumoffii NY 23]MCW8385848.1 hypothetical protein [Fluoribacter dumoffii]MCW8418901.1 hypothetical protein [Fluoribacter dumoffii]MCW8453255.1 hypothetical protein [Fluoribacter dumoffii]MCW8459524.1 hypothetical protein [Fluoribacter dumoffii]
MKINSSVAGLMIAIGMIAVVGTTQASCYKHQPGWHMVSKKCPIKPADNWQEYTSGVYTQPVTGKSLFQMNR